MLCFLSAAISKENLRNFMFFFVSECSLLIFRDRKLLNPGLVHKLLNNTVLASSWNDLSTFTI